MEAQLEDHRFEEEHEEGGVPFFPHHIMKEVIAAYLVIGILLTLAILLPFELKERANPLETPEGIKPEWYFLGPYQVLKYVPKVVGIIGMGIAALLFIIFPFLDKSPYKAWKKRPLASSIAMVLLVIMLFLSFLGYVSESRRKLLGRVYEFDLRGVPHEIKKK